MENQLILKEENQIQEITNEMYTSYIDYLDATKQTINQYKKGIKQFYSYCHSDGRNINQPTRQDILNYKNLLIDTKSANTTNAYIIAIRLFFSWASSNGLYPNIAEHVKGVKISSDFKKDNLTLEQAKELINSVDTTSINGLRDKAIICLMLNCGLRDIEIQRANIKDIRTLGNNVVLYIQGKGRTEKNDFVKITNKTYKIINQYLQARQCKDNNAPLFASLNHGTLGERLTTRSISRIIKTRLESIGIKSDRITAHSLRHTTATLNLLNGGTLEETQQLLRHKNINTTMVYVHHLQREKNQSEQRIANVLFDD